MYVLVPLLTLAFAAPLSVVADFDGDGKQEKISGGVEKLALSGVSDEIWCVEGECELEVVDIRSEKPGKALSVCVSGPQDWRGCRVWFYPRDEKYGYGGQSLKLVAQPLYATQAERSPDGFTWTPGRVFPMYDAVNGKTVVAHVAGKHPVMVVAEAGDSVRLGVWEAEKRWFLVRTQSGLLGWARLGVMIAGRVSYCVTETIPAVSRTRGFKSRITAVGNTE